MTSIKAEDVERLARSMDEHVQKLLCSNRGRDLTRDADLCRATIRAQAARIVELEGEIADLQEQIESFMRGAC